MKLSLLRVLAAAAALMIMLPLAACDKNVSDPDIPPSPVPEVTPSSDPYADAYKLLSRGEAVATIPGDEILEGEYYATLADIMMLAAQQTGAIDWAAAMPDGRMPADYFKEEALKECALSLAVKNEAIRLGCIPTDEHLSLLQQQTTDLIAQMGGSENFNAIIDSYMMSEEIYNYLSTLNTYKQTLYEYYYGDNGVELPAEGTYEKTEMPPYSRVKHVLITTVDIATNMPLDDATIAEKKSLAEQILARAKSGEDFDALVNEYGEDPGMEQSPTGYVVTNNGQMVVEFETAALALKDNEVSDIVETSYGYHILKRLPFSEDELNALKSNHDLNDRYAYSDTLYDAKLNALRNSVEITTTPLLDAANPQSVFETCLQKQAALQEQMSQASAGAAP